MCLPRGSWLAKHLRANVWLMMTGMGAGCGPVGLAAEVGTDLPPVAGVWIANSSAAATAALVSLANARSPEVNGWPATKGMRIAEKKSRPTGRMSVLTFDLGGAPSRCTLVPDRPPPSSWRRGHRARQRSAAADRGKDRWSGDPCTRQIWD